MQDALKLDDMFFSKEGGAIDYVNSVTGEILLSVGVPAGVQAVRPYLDARPNGAHIEIVEGLAVVPKRGRAWVGKVRAEDRHKSGANPDFKPTSATRMEQELRLTINKLIARQDTADRQLRAMEKVQRIPKAPPKEDADEAALVEAPAETKAAE